MTRYDVSKRMCELIHVAGPRAVRGAELYFVASSRPGEWYTVDLDKGTCTCPDGRAPMVNGRRYCKHYVAVELSK